MNKAELINEILEILRGLPVGDIKSILEEVFSEILKNTVYHG